MHEAYRAPNTLSHEAFVNNKAKLLRRICIIIPQIEDRIRENRGAPYPIRFKVGNKTAYVFKVRPEFVKTLREKVLPGVIRDLRQAGEAELATQIIEEHPDIIDQ